MNIRHTLILIIVAICASSGAQRTSLPAYVPAQQVAGVIRTCGSPQMGALLKLWEAGFQKVQPGVYFQNGLKGTSSSIAGLFSGRADIALLGRDIWPAEVQAFQSVYGYGPTSVQVATGSYNVPKATYALMIFVQKSNPLTKISLPQLADIFGAANTSHPNEIRAWGELGLTGKWTQEPIHLYGFNLENDKSIFFQKTVLKRGRRWNCRMKEYSNSTSRPPVDAGQLILNALAKDIYGIAISNAHYAVAGVKVLAVGIDNGRSFVAPTKENVQARIYPLARPVHIVFNRNPQTALDPKVKEFLRYILSSEGQEDVVKENNYLPLTKHVVYSELRVLK